MTVAKKLFVPNGTGKYIFHKNVLERMFLKTAAEQRKIVSISIAGAMRTGKSFMLNFLLRYLKARYVKHDMTQWLGNAEDPLEGFEWREDLDAVTVGILIWPEVFLYDDSSNSEKCAIVLMDTQGFFDHTQTSFDHSAIFSLSSIMASTQIYNIFKDLNQSNLNNIYQFSKEGITNMRMDSITPFQRLVLLIRDWAMPKAAAYGFEGGKELLRRRMRGKLGEPVRGFFESIECFLMRQHMPTSADNEDFDGRLSRLDQEFINLLDIFVPMILAPDQLKPRKLNGYALDTTNFVSNFEFFAAFYSEGNVKGVFPEINDNNFALNALDASVRVYEDFVNKKQGTSSLFTSDLLKSYHDVAKDLSLKYYDEVGIELKIAAVYRQRLIRDLDEIYKGTLIKITLMDGEINNNSILEHFNDHVKNVLIKIKDFFPIIGNVLREIWRAIPEDLKKEFGQELKRMFVEKIVEGVGKILDKI